MMTPRAVAPRERGATAVEYALIVALIATVIAGAVYLLGQAMPAWYTVVF